MTQEEFDKLPLLDKILYDTTGMLVENHPSIAEAMEKYHQAKLKLLDVTNVNNMYCSCHQSQCYLINSSYICVTCNRPLGK